jgi:hypothetical protein
VSVVEVANTALHVYSGACSLVMQININFIAAGISTYDHRSVKTGHPVRSAIHKH